MFHNGNPVYKRINLFILSLFFGIMGIDRMYVKDYKNGLLKFITLGGLGIWYFLDLFNIGIGNKIGPNSYSYTCEISKKFNCLYETNLILKGLMFFALASVIIIYFYYPRNIHNIVVSNEPKDI